MSGESNITTLLENIKPCLNNGDFVFCAMKDLALVNLEDVLMFFKEKEATTIIVKKEIAEALNLDFSFIASWITLTVHSSLSAVGLTAAFSKALADHNISCNVVAAFYHDHIFVAKADADKAICVLGKLTE